MLCSVTDCLVSNPDEVRWQNECTSTLARSGIRSSRCDRYSTSVSLATCTDLFPLDTGQCTYIIGQGLRE